MRLAVAVQLKAVPRQSEHGAGDRLRAVWRDHLLEGAPILELIPPRAVVLRGRARAGVGVQTTLVVVGEPGVGGDDSQEERLLRAMGAKFRKL